MEKDWRSALRKILSPRVREAGVTNTAHRIGVSAPTLSKWLAGESAISEKKLRRLAALFGYAVEIKSEISKIAVADKRNAAMMPY